MAGRGTSAKPAEQKANDSQSPAPADDQSTAPSADTKPAEQKAAKPAKGEVTVKVATAISGTRNGEPWPAVGEPITLPADEAASYIQFGYVVPIGD